MFGFFKSKRNVQIKKDKKIKLALVLGGGGCRGIGHIGVLKAFDELGVDFDFIVGTSVGSIIGSLYAYGKTGAEIEQIVLGLKKRDIMGGGIPFVKPIKTEKIEKLLNEVFGDVKVFSELKKPLTIVCTDLKTGKEIDFNYGDVAKVVSASCAVPGIFTPVKYDDMHLIDGGVRNNVPVDVAKKMGANVVFAVDVNHLRGTGTLSLSTTSVLSQTISIMMQAKVDKTLELADLIFKPSLEQFSPLKFDNLEEMIEIGYNTVINNKDTILKMLSVKPNKIGKIFTKYES